MAFDVNDVFQAHTFDFGFGFEFEKKNHHK